VLYGITVVFHIAGLGGIDGVVSAHGAVLAGEPMRASLAEDDVAWDDILFSRLLGSKSLARTIFGFIYRSLRFVGRVSDGGLEERVTSRRSADAEVEGCEELVQAYITAGTSTCSTN